MQAKTLPAIIILLWCLSQFFYARPESIVDDWMGWRQADTQTIALNFLIRDFNIFYPRINWGGDGPGYVEAEFQLYPFMIAVLMKLTGKAEWPGHCINIVFMALSGVLLYRMLCQKFGQYSAAIAAAFFLTSRGPVFLSTSIQPEAFCFLCYVLGLMYFMCYIDTQAGTCLFRSMVWTALASLVKPTALSLGITQFLMVVLAKPVLVRSSRLWLGWSAVLSVVIIYMLHGYNLYLTYGNTFGIIGGDSKFPALHHLVMPWLYLKISAISVLWGLGYFGALAGFFLFVRRQLQPLEWALALGNAVMLIIAMRYTSSRGYGPHYHLITAVLGTYCAAHAVHYFRHSLVSHKALCFFTMAAVACSIVQYGFHLNLRHDKALHAVTPAPIIHTGKKLAGIVRPDDKVVVRSTWDSVIESFWGTGVNNYEDPRIFYAARTTGWVLPNDLKGFATLSSYKRRGAQYYIETGKYRDDPQLYDWLDKNCTLVFADQDGRIYALHKEAASMPRSEMLRKNLKQAGINEQKIYFSKK